MVGKSSVVFNGEESERPCSASAFLELPGGSGEDFSRELESRTLQSNAEPRHRPE